MSTSSALWDLLDRRSLQQNVPVESTVVVGVSGGADSVALLLALHALSPVYPLCLVCVHVNHGLRAEAPQEEAFVRALCHRLKIPLHIFSLNLGTKSAGASSEQHWRQQRYEVFEKAVIESRGQFLALGHNADDLAETFLFHLVRGTGVPGLTFSFYKKSGQLPIIRPLWQTQRLAIETVLKNINQSWMTDPSNDDTRFSRNLIRHDVLPILKKLNPRASEAIMRASQSLSGDGVLQKCSAQAPAQLAISSVRGLSDLSAAREIYGFITAALSDAPGKRKIDQALSMIRHNRTGIVALGSNLSLVITQTNLWIAPLDQPTDLQLASVHTEQFHTVAADLHEDFLVSGGQAKITLLNGKTITVSVPSAPNAGRQLVLRNRQPGDLVGTKPLKKVMIDFQIPWYLRDHLVVVGAEKQVLHVLGTLPELNNWIARHTGRHLDINVDKEFER